ncbi:lanthionine synthetase C family protein [Pedobacter sp. AW1-32]|uniref:lanthionine synthetase C family protein n=1 Tax=Pedobacter sp. AW1-32 TaxID=3383026 RepID=UPI003FEFF388
MCGPQDLNVFIQEKLKSINLFLYHKIKSKDFVHNLSLISGTSGLALFFYENDRLNPAAESKKICSKAIEYTYKSVEQATALPASLASGLAGWGWFLSYIRYPDAYYYETCTEIDPLLLNEYNRFIDAQHYDLLHGAIGVGLYLMKRQKYESVEILLKALYSNGIFENGEVKWERYDQFNYQEHIIDFGFAHGVAGILAFVLKCYEKNICKDLCIELMEKGFRFYQNNMNPHSETGSFFPTKIQSRFYGSEVVHPPAMQSWCYGDLAISLILLKISKALQNQEKEKQVIRILHQIVGRRIVDEQKITDAGFCHGSSGIAYLYLKICKILPHTIFEQELDYWMSKLVGETAGFEFYLGENKGWGEVTGLLNGITGTGMVLLSYLNRNLETGTAWDECLLLS